MFRQCDETDYEHDDPNGNWSHILLFVMLQNLSNAIIKCWFSKSNKPSRRMTIPGGYCDSHWETRPIFCSKESVNQSWVWWLQMVLRFWEHFSFLDVFCNLHDSGIEHPEKFDVIHRRAKQRHVKSKNATLSISFNTIYKNEHSKITTPMLSIWNTWCLNHKHMQWNMNSLLKKECPRKANSV